MKGTDGAAAATDCLGGKCAMRRRRRGQGQQAAARQAAWMALVWAGCVLLGLGTVPGAGWLQNPDFLQLQCTKEIENLSNPQSLEAQGNIQG